MIRYAPEYPAMSAEHVHEELQLPNLAPLRRARRANHRGEYRSLMTGQSAIRNGSSSSSQGQQPSLRSSSSREQLSSQRPSPSRGPNSSQQSSTPRVASNLRYMTSTDDLNETQPRWDDERQCWIDPRLAKPSSIPHPSTRRQYRRESPPSPIPQPPARTRSGRQSPPSPLPQPAALLSGYRQMTTQAQVFGQSTASATVGYGNFQRSQGYGPPTPDLGQSYTQPQGYGVSAATPQGYGRPYVTPQGNDPQATTTNAFSSHRRRQATTTEPLPLFSQRAESPLPSAPYVHQPLLGRGRRDSDGPVIPSWLEEPREVRQFRGTLDIEADVAEMERERKRESDARRAEDIWDSYEY
ncbi:hypothetical protein BT63DRAFT_416571 [Microthyrium microscopicum]|uniref:Uncharacterized protein n=1 Tax=Microthyrium microscopicum TaxID=703497 RepID=A0A6A6U1J1_9PEZI|nr:hypothetical protein BT63DRAFT_416571 [Microthyrium microscopicum]